MKTSIITVTYNSEKFVKPLLESIKKQNINNKNDVEVILVDSFSQDKTVEKIKQLLPAYKIFFKIILIEKKKNVGFTYGSNLGFKKALGKYVFFLGPDTKLEKRCLYNLLRKTREVKKDDYILVCRQCRYNDKQFLFDGICLDIFHFPYKLYNADFPQKTKKPFYCDGAAIFLPKNTFLKLGKFDEKLFMFCDDIDLSWKAHLMKIPLISVPKAIVYHFSGASMKGGIRKGRIYHTTYLRRYLGERNTIRNFLKNYSLLTLIIIMPIYLMINLAEIIIFIIFKRQRAVWQYLAAWWWNIYSFKDTLKKRRWIQKRRRINDLEIIKKLYFGSGKYNAFKTIKIPIFES